MMAGHLFFVAMRCDSTFFRIPRKMIEATAPQNALDPGMRDINQEQAAIKGYQKTKDTRNNLEGKQITTWR